MCDAAHDPVTSVIGIIALVVSNIGFGPLAVLAYHYGYPIASFIYLGVFFNSSFYHLCKPLNGWCLLPYSFFWTADFLFAFLTLPVTIHYFLPYRRPLMEQRETLTSPLRNTVGSYAKASSIQVSTQNRVLFDGLHGKEAIVYAFYAFLIAILISLKMINIYGYLIVVGLALLETTIILLYYGIYFKVWPVFTWPLLVLGLVTLLVGAGLYLGQEYFTGQPELYAAIHSPWHVFVTLGQMALLFAFVRLDTLWDELAMNPNDTLRYQFLRTVNQQRNSPWTALSEPSPVGWAMPYV